jgi:cell division protein FtsB
MKLFHFLFNKYTITAAAFAMLMFFFDQNDYASMQERNRELKDVKDNIEYLNKEIAQLDANYNALMQDPKELERYARERYRMKRDTEDLYVIEKK